MKKKTPLIVHRFVSKWLKRRGSLFTVNDPGNHLFVAVDKEPDTGFRFIISKYKDEGSSVKYCVSRRPRNDRRVDEVTAWIQEHQVEAWFQKWIEVLDEYDSIESIEDIRRSQKSVAKIFNAFNVDADLQNEYPTLPQLQRVDAHLTMLEIN